VRDNCKYLGMFFDRTSGLNAHLALLSSRFPSSVTVFFQLVRKLQVSNLRLLFRLTTSLLLSSLYGVEFVKHKSSIQSLEVIALGRAFIRFWGFQPGYQMIVCRYSSLGLALIISC
jgi:hypothetical protein